MKISILKSAKIRANILMVTLLVALVLGMTLTSYLILVDGQSRSVARSQIWNQALVVTEAGVEDAMAFVNQFAGSPAILTWPSTASANNWTSPAGNVYVTTRYLDASHKTYYTAYVTNNLFATPTIRVTGSVPGPSWLANPNRISRTVIIGAKTDVLFNAAMAALGAIDLKGNGIATDSFDSSATNWPGYWTNTIRKAGGDVATDSTITNFTIGNADIAGHARTGPGGGYTIMLNGSVGDLAWVDGGSSGVEPGWFADDMNTTFKPVIIPSDQTWWNAGAAGEGQSGTVNGVSYAHVFTAAANGRYYNLNDSGDIYIGTNVTISLKAKSTVGTFKPDNIYVAGTGANAGKLTCYVDCGSCTLGSGDMTQSKLAGNMVFLGTTNCTSLAYKGNGDFTGAMYFPQADFQLAGGGAGIIDFIGSSVTKTVQMNGHYHFHFDEALKKWNPNNAYIADSWREITGL
jgi:hypothetical protein